ncbi:MAG: hypothetical protein HY744_01290 [Deltaproteobacteria bacterium]|nr:hypothetical protein [Deltaproteobacteria bacterium]
MGKSRRTLRDNLAFRLGRTMNEVLLRFEPDDLVALGQRVHELSRERGLFYEDGAKRMQVIPLLLRPRILSREQLRYFQKLCHTIIEALERLYYLWSTDSEVRALLPLTPEEQSWFSHMPKGAAQAPQAIFGRLDVQVDFSDPHWDKSCHFFEANTVGAGGIHYACVADAIVLETIVAKMQRYAPHFLVQPADDARLLLLHTLTAHADEIGIRRLNIGFLQDRRGAGGPEEFPSLVAFFRERGLEAALCDPRELELRSDQLWVGDLPVDILYRDTTIADLCGFERDGADLSALRWAFANGRVVSSLAGEFDHKSAFEILSDPRFAAHFTAGQRKAIARHIPWTRTLREVSCSGPDGSEIDLLTFVHRNREALVLKPNRGFGGGGIVIGPFAELGEWDQAIEAALHEPGSTVVQQYVPSLIKDFTVLSADGRARIEEYYVVCGFFATPDGLGILGRASRKRVVNVAQKGALVACMVLA